MKNPLRPFLYSAKVRSKDLFNIPRIRLVEHDLTKVCNSRCQYCDIWQNKKVGTELTIDEIRKVYSDPILKYVETVIVTGGEPTTRPDLLEVYKTIHECIPKATLQLSTNAILKDKVVEIVTKCLELGMKFEVGISLDGVGKDHDEVRRVPGNFDNVNYVINKLKRLQEQYGKQLDICLGMTVSDLTVDKHKGIENYAKSKGLRLEYAWIEQTPFYDNADKVINVTKNNIKDLVINLPDSPRKRMWLRDIDGKSIRFKCYALKTFFVLRYDGGVAPCLHYYDNVIGNVKEKSISEILLGYEAKKVKKHIVKPCKGCLNTWAFAESNMAQLTPYLRYYLMHPLTLIRELKK